VVLLDEPFSSLDAGLRQQVRAEVGRILRASGTSALFVTHDQEEALQVGDRIAVLNAGELEQVGTPEEVFSAPSTRFVAEFMGQTDFLPGRMAAEGVETEIGCLRPLSGPPRGSAVEVALRPDDVDLAADPEGPARVLTRTYRGTHSLYAVELPSGRRLHSLQPHTLSLPGGARVRVVAAAGHPLPCFPASGRSGPHFPAGG
jgi:iron(III) transport system ATP-binding protein